MGHSAAHDLSFTTGSSCSFCGSVRLSLPHTATVVFGKASVPACLLLRGGYALSYSTEACALARIFPLKLAVTDMLRLVWQDVIQNREHVLDHWCSKTFHEVTTPQHKSKPAIVHSYRVSYHFLHCPEIPKLSVDMVVKPSFFSPGFILKAKPSQSLSIYDNLILLLVQYTCNSKQ